MSDGKFVWWCDVADDDDDDECDWFFLTSTSCSNSIISCCCWMICWSFNSWFWIVTCSISLSICCEFGTVEEETCCCWWFDDDDDDEVMDLEMVDGVMDRDDGMP